MRFTRPFLVLLCVLSLSAVARFSQVWVQARSAVATSIAAPFAASSPELASPKTPEAVNAARQAYGQLPLAFEANGGQTAAAVRYLARGNGYGVFLTADEAILRLRGSAPDADQAAVLRLRLRDAQVSTPQASGALPGVSNYFVGDAAENWRTNVRTYERVTYPAVYPGVALVWYGNQRQLEHDFELAPGADARRIVWQVSGAQKLTLTKDGAINVELASGTTVRWRKPEAWQVINGQRRAVAVEYVLPRAHEIGFRLGSYDRRQPLVIDPVLQYSTFLGGNGTDNASSVAVDAAGNAYVTGWTLSTNFPGPSALQAAKGAQQEAFVLKLNPAGNALLYATWLGGGGNDVGSRIAVDTSGNAVILGTTASTNFPVKNALQTTRKGSNEVFVTKLNAAGDALLFSTYLGGAGNDVGSGLALDAQANVYLTGTTDSTDFPLQNPLQNAKRGSVLHTSTNGGSAWTDLSPGLNVGQVAKLAIDPKTPTTLYAATERGLFKSTNSGAAWTQLPNLPFTFATQIVIDPVTPTTLYVVASAVLYKSTDAGATWTALPAPDFVRGFALDEKTPTTLYAGGTFISVQKSTDGGATWTEQNIPPPFGGGPAVEVYNLATDPQTSGTVYAIGNRGVFKTTNGGTNWLLASNGMPGSVSFSQPGDIAISRSNPQMILLYRAGLGTFRTTDGANNWQFVTFGNGIESPLVLAFDPTNANIAYAGTTLGVLKSTNGGSTWSFVNSGLNSLVIRALAIAPNAPQTLYVGSPTTTDGFVSKLSADGSALLYSTYLGGPNTDSFTGLAVDGTGNAYVSGSTQSMTFPGLNALQTSLKGTADGFVAKLNPTGTAVLWASYLGGAGADVANDLAVNAAGNVFVTGTTSSTDFPLAKAVQTTNRSTVLGLAEAFVTRFSADGKTLDYSTYLGGTELEEARTIAVDAAGHAYVGGVTSSRDFPLANPLQATLNGNEQTPGLDAFVTKFSPDGTSLLYSTFLGGRSTETANGLAVDGSGNLYVVGVTGSSDFPTTTNPLHAELDGLESFIAKLALNADLAVTLTEALDPVMVNNPLTLTATVTNNGPDQAAGVALSLTLPTGITNVSATASQGSCATGAPLNCALGTLAARASATVTLTFTPTAVATLTTRATATTTTPDATTTNNSATQETRVVATPSIYGRVTLGSAGLSGVSLALTGANRPAAQTNADGAYQFAELPSGGNYTVTPARTGFVFNPASRSFNNLTSDQRGDFAATACRFTLSPSSQSLPATGGTGLFTLTATDPQCPWTARSNAPWLTLTSASSGNGNATVRFSVAPSVGARSGTLTVGGVNFLVFQEANPCTGLTLGAGLTTLPLPTGVNYDQRYFLLRDFNQDGRVDLAVFLNGNTPTLQLLPGLANGQFGAPITVMSLTTAGAQFSGLSAADFNNDGKLDLAVTGGDPQNGGRVWLINGDGAGGFAQPRPFALANPNVPPLGLLSGDVNGDGRPDVIVGLNAAPFGAVLLNDGAGGLSAARNLPANQGSFPSDQLTLGELDGDGKLDLVRRDGPLLNLYKGDGTGNFTTLPNLGLPFTTSVVWGDFNGDNRLDFAYTTQDQAGGSQLILQVRLNNGSGQFPNTLTTNFAAPFDLSQAALVAADFNLDGRTDLAFSPPASANLQGRSLWFFPGEGTGRFNPPQLYALSDAQGSATTGDYNRDGRPDLFFLSFNGTFNLVTASATGFNAQRGFNHGGGGAMVAVGDVNGDGLSDVVVGSSAFGSSASGLVWLPGNGRGEYGAPVRVNSAAFSTGLGAFSLRDFNRDGRPDLATLEPAVGSLRIFLNNGQGQFTLRTTLNVAPNSTRLEAGDFNRDGTPDLVLRGATGGLNLYLGDGQGGFTPSATELGGANAGQEFALGDFNGDGALDLVLPDPAQANNAGTGRFLLLYGNGQGGFGAPQLLATTALVYDVRAADLNLDGRDDLLYRISQNSGTLQIVLANAEGGFAPPVSYPAPDVALSTLVVADLNGDGKPDLLTLNNNFDTVSFWQGKGDGSFLAAVTQPLAGQPAKLLPVDADEDGSLDLVGASIFAPGVFVYQNRTSCLANGGLLTASAASYGRSRNAANAISALFGAGLAPGNQTATATPLPTTLGTTSLRIRDSAGVDRLAPLFFVSPNQINYLTPVGVAPGVATLTVLNGATTVATGTTLIAPVAPGLFTANAAGTGLAAAVALRVRADGLQVYEPVFRLEQGRFVPVPIDLSNPAEQVFLLLYGTGIRQRSALSAVTVTLGGTPLEVSYAGNQGLAGLDQINIRLPGSLAGRGLVEVQLTVEGRAANPVTLAIK